jgi:DNA-binding IclR family transcriptional regulator
VTGYAKTVDQALALLGSIAADGAGSADVLGRRLGLNPTVTHRLLKTLDRRGFVRRDPQGEYVLGAALFELSTQVEPELRHIARPTLERLAGRFGETAVLSVPDRGDAVAVDEVLGEPHVVRVHYRPGFRHPLYLAAHGRAILAFLDPDAIGRLLADLPDAELVREQLDETRRLGYACSSDELQRGTRGLASPIRDAAGRVAGSIGVVAPQHRFPPVRHLAPAIYEAAATVGMALGHRPSALEPGVKPLLRVT